MDFTNLCCFNGTSLTRLIRFAFTLAWSRNVSATHRHRSPWTYTAHVEAGLQVVAAAAFAASMKNIVESR